MKDWRFNLILCGLVIFSLGGLIGSQSTIHTVKQNNFGIANQVEQVRSSVVHISKEGVCQGSGAVISPDGIIMTAKHVTDGGGVFVVTTDDGKEYMTTICVESKEFDVAFLKIETDKPLPCSPMADLKTVRVGDPVFIMGSPFGSSNFNSVSLGIVSASQRNLDVPESAGWGWKVTFQSDATAEPGNSGGPVFDINGQIIGVLVAGMDATVNYSVPVAVFMYDMDVIQQWFQLAQFEVQENKPIIVEPSYNNVDECLISGVSHS
jgi:S1-C subfamily serine protease